ncbi:uncharacterized protein LOC143298026 [Babylonia areolata]|uniref:uncharacterized protein LOC143298026 n=1 Tax=Babylonia areolata TaxID=304850 RepID=UPI003FD5C1D5
MSTEGRTSWPSLCDSTGEQDVNRTPADTTDPAHSVQLVSNRRPAETDEAPTHGEDVPLPLTTPETTQARDSGNQNGPASPAKAGPCVRVSIREDRDAPAHKRVTSGRLRIERELSRLKEVEEQERRLQKSRRKMEEEKAVEAVHREREKKGVTLTPDVEACRAAVRHMMREEERLALAPEQKKLCDETKALHQQIRNKYAVKGTGLKHDLVALTESFYHGKVKDKDGIPEHVHRHLTRQEIEDLRMVFDMFDVKGKGYIIPNDVRRAASMLGFKAKKEVFSSMIEEVTGKKKGRVTFSHFLQFVVRGQGDGDDPLDAILQCFRMLDRDQKGYITASDLRHAAESQKLPLSNRAIREMIQEADVTGDSKVTSDEFIHIMLQSSLFRTVQ